MVHTVFNFTSYTIAVVLTFCINRSNEINTVCLVFLHSKQRKYRMAC